MMYDVRGLMYVGSLHSLQIYQELARIGELKKNMEIPKIKEDESLAMWRERLARELNLDDRMQEIIREVSVTSYIHGTNVTLDILKKEGRL